MIQRMLQELSGYHRDKETIMREAIAERLDASYKVYTSELEYSVQFLEQRQALSILKRVNKLNGKSCK